MDLLDSILGSMDKPPSMSEKEKELKASQKKDEEVMRKWRNSFKRDTEKKVWAFLEDSTKKKFKLPPAQKLERMIIHEVAEAAGLISHSFGVEDVDKHIVLFKKEFPPSEEELKALRNGEEYDPTKVKVAETTPPDNERLQPQATETGRKYGIPSNYQEKYRKLLGGLDCAEKSAIKMEPNKAFGYVPSSNKRDLRSIEQTLNDLKSRKKPKLDTELSSEDQADPPPE